MHKHRFADAYIHECVRWRNTSGGMTWAKTRIEMCFFSRRLPTRNYTRSSFSYSRFPSFFLSFFSRWFCSCKACNRKANCGRMIHMTMVAASGWFMERGCLLFSHDNGEKRARNKISKIFRRFIFDAMENSVVEFRLDLRSLEYWEFWYWKYFSAALSLVQYRILPFIFWCNMESRYRILPFIFHAILNSESLRSN